MYLLVHFLWGVTFSSPRGIYNINVCILYYDYDEDYLFLKNALKFGFSWYVYWKAWEGRSMCLLKTSGLVLSSDTQLGVKLCDNLLSASQII